MSAIRGFIWFQNYTLGSGSKKGTQEATLPEWSRLLISVVLGDLIACEIYTTSKKSGARGK